MRTDSLQKLWEREIDRISPEGDPLNLMALMQYAIERIQQFLEKIVPDKSPVHLPNVTPHALYITIAVILFCALVAFLLKRYGSVIRATVTSMIPHDEFSSLWGEFHALVSSGSNAKAIRFFVQSLSSIHNLAHSTFAEIFPSIGNSPAASVRESYGRVIHKKSGISRDEIEKFATHVVAEYPRVARSHTSMPTVGSEKK